MINTPAPRFTNATNDGQWPDGDFKPDITINASGSQLTVAGTLLNVSDYVYGVPIALQATVTLWVNSTPTSTYTLDAQTGTITGAPTPVNPGDQITVRFESKATIPSPYNTQTVQRQDLNWTVPAGGGSISFSQSVNPQQAPSWGAVFEWQAGAGPLTWTHTPTADDGATQNLTLQTELAGGGAQSVSVFNQNPAAGPQTHTAAFDKAAAAAGFVVSFWWQNNALNRASYLAILFRDANLVGPGSTFQQSKVAGAASREP
ncbi:MAG: hypothetical protein AAFV53_19890 [Myxococcota bacterium]